MIIFVCSIDKYILYHWQKVSHHLQTTMYIPNISIVMQKFNIY
jgi:hypothetical protein